MAHTISLPLLREIKEEHEEAASAVTRAEGGREDAGDDVPRVDGDYDREAKERIAAAAAVVDSPFRLVVGVFQEALFGRGATDAIPWHCRPK